jgi:hypothetical protein
MSTSTSVQVAAAAACAVASAVYIYSQLSGDKRENDAELELIRAELKQMRAANEQASSQLEALQRQLKEAAASEGQLRQRLDKVKADEEAARVELEERDARIRSVTSELKALREQSHNADSFQSSNVTPGARQYDSSFYPSPNSYYAAQSIDGDLRSVRSEYLPSDGKGKVRGVLAPTEKKWGNAMVRSSLFTGPEVDVRQPRRQLAM